MLKRLTALLMVLTLVTTASAQFRWGPTAGINITDYQFKQHLLDIKPGVGANAGIMGELMFPGIGLGIDLGLNYNMHQAKMDFGAWPVWGSDGNRSVVMHTLQIPINLKFKYTRLNGVERMVAPFVYGGPVFSINLAHNDVPPLEYSGGSFMLQCGLGAELFRRFQLSGGYYWGMTYELRTVKLDNYSARPKGWLVKLVYFL